MGGWLFLVALVLALGARPVVASAQPPLHVFAAPLVAAAAWSVPAEDPRDSLPEVPAEVPSLAEEDGCDADEDAAEPRGSKGPSLGSGTTSQGFARPPPEPCPESIVVARDPRPPRS